MFTATFTDPQGVEHTDAIFEVSVANYSIHTQESYDFRISQGDDPSNQITSGDNSYHLSYQMYYWTNQAARDAGKLPYYLANKESVSEYFHVPESYLADSAYVSLTAVEKAEKHCKEVVLGITE